MPPEKPAAEAARRSHWNLCLDRLIEAWNTAGPDAVLAALSRLRDEPGEAEDATGDAA